MSPLALHSLVFSLVALPVLAFVERLGWRGLAALQRVTLGLLLAFPLLLVLPKWHILPTARDAAFASGGESARGWAALWLGGSAVLAARMAVAAWRLRGIARRAHVVTDENDLILARDCAQRVGLRHPGVLRVSSGISSPAACGLWRPVVLLPADWPQWPEETKRAVLLHELGHHAADDPLWRMLAMAAAGFYWFNPVVWWLAARLRGEAEFACDERVVSCGVGAGNYARILCDLAGRPPAGALAMAVPGGLERRVRRLCGRRGVAAPLLIGTAALALAATSLGLAVLRPSRPAAKAPPVYDATEIATRRQATPFPSD